MLINKVSLCNTDFKNRNIFKLFNFNIEDLEKTLITNNL